MDTKWKNRKKWISFMIFALGVSLVLGNGIGLLDRWPSGVPAYQLDQALSEDYQHGEGFRWYISDRLESFLLMATNSLGSKFDYSVGWQDKVIEENNIASVQGGYDFSWNEATEVIPGDGTFDYFYQEEEPLTEEQQREIAQKYHDSIRGDLNLLYAISYDGKLLYTNSEEFAADGSLTPPEGYNFLLRYADGQVQIFKDGQELDVYGDGYYRDNDAWYVPGYRNFQVDEEMKKAVIYMAAAEMPVLYTETNYDRGGYRQLDNSLYWMQYNTVSQRTLLLRNMAGLGAGLILLLLSFFFRKTKKEADRVIAGFTGKIWFEAKVLLPLLLLILVLTYHFRTGYAYDLWMEISYAYTYESFAEATYWYGDLLLCSLPAAFWLLLFWWICLAVNDLRYNRKPWKQSLAGKLHRAFTAGQLHLSLPRRMARRNLAAFLGSVVYSLYMIIVGIGGLYLSCPVWTIPLLFLPGTAGFLLYAYLIGTKQMETARDMEALSDRISDIRSGNYTADGDGPAEKPFPSDHDLAPAMTQLEDIRHGMANAVDEQMKSERMKVELIANVSHDIKTPLTSIISYVQFLKDEEGLPEHVRDYILILDEKSQRLKNMVQDVFAVSKAASGELPMHMEKLDFGKLLRQTLADMEEQIAGSRVTFRTEIPDTPVMIIADGQRMYRVFQNLFQNAIQYSLEGSRVHVTLKTDDGLAVASVQNTSRCELSKDKDFTERFVRGDQSRTDGGSGLGLSIAQSFTEASGGTFRLETIADLFVVTVSFHLPEEK